MLTPTVAIIGAGPLATYALERLAAVLAGAAPGCPCHIHVYERTGEFGAGATHSASQGATSYLNRVASQVGFAADESNAGARHLLPPASRPTLFEWCEEQFARTGAPQFLLAPGTVPPRCLHGMALAQMFGQNVALLRAMAGVTVTLHADDVIDLAPDAEGRLQVCTCAGGAGIGADHVLLATGHGGFPTCGTAMIAPPYPLAERLAETAVPPGCTVGMLGTGLSAIDAILHLTEGRDGMFLEDDGRLRYRRSRREPACIVVASPSGLFPCCRAHNDKAADGSARGHAAHNHQARFLTAATLASLRLQFGQPMRLAHGVQRQLDFEQHILPLLVLEMACLYYDTLLGCGTGDQLARAAHDRVQAFLGHAAGAGDAVAALLAPVEQAVTLLAGARAPVPRFDWRRLFWPLDARDAPDAPTWRMRLLHHMKNDLHDAAQGSLRNPNKAACDGAWRDLRSFWSALLDFGGLTAASHRRFDAHYHRAYARMANGAAIEPMRRIVALIEAGVLDPGIGPGPQVRPGAIPGTFTLHGARTDAVRDVDVLVEGRVARFDARDPVQPLYPNLLRRGLVRLWTNPAADPYVPGAVDITPDLHPYGAGGKADTRITVAGAPVEGVLSFQLSLARPHADSAILNRLSDWAEAIAVTLHPPAAAAPARRAG